MRTHRRPARKLSTTKRSTTSRASVAVRPCRSTCACHAKSPRRSRRITRGSSPTTTPSTYSRVSVMSKCVTPVTRSESAASASASSLTGRPCPAAGGGTSTRSRPRGSGTTSVIADANRSRSSVTGGGGGALGWTGAGGAGRVRQRLRRSWKGAFSGAGRVSTSSDDRPRRAMPPIYHRDPPFTEGGAVGAHPVDRVEPDGLRSDSRNVAWLGLGGVLGLHEGTITLGSQLLEGAPRQPARQDVTILPAADGREGHAQRMGQAFLSETRAVTPGANELASVGGRAAGDAGVGGGGVELHSEVHLAASWSNRHASPTHEESLHPALGKAPNSPDRVKTIQQDGLLPQRCTGCLPPLRHGGVVGRRRRGRLSSDAE